MNIHEYLKENGSMSLGGIIRKIEEFKRFEYLEKEQLVELATLGELLRLTCIVSAEISKDGDTFIPVL